MSVTGPSVGLCQDRVRLGRGRLPRSQQEVRIKIALHGTIADAPPPISQAHSPVQADGVATGLRHGPQQASRSRPEMDGRDVESCQTLKQTAHVRHDGRAVVKGRQLSHPRVKDLHDLRAGTDLGSQVGQIQVHEAAHQTIPHRRVRVHQGLGPLQLTG